jgi:hypothetical protein
MLLEATSGSIINSNKNSIVSTLDDMDSNKKQN